MIKRLLVFTLPLLFFLGDVVCAAGPSTSGAIILEQGMSARALGMGEAFAAIADDINAISYNPAGLACLNKSEINFCYLKGLVDTHWGVISYACPLRIGTMGISVFTLQAGTMDVYDAGGNLTGAINAQSDYVFVFSYALAVNKKLFLGLNVKGLYSTLGQNYSAATYAVDTGLLYQIFEKLKAGIAVQNAGGEIKYIDVGDPLPLNFKAGIAWEVFTRQKFDNISIAVDVNYPNDSILRYNLGAEYKNLEMGAAIRAGYKFGEVLGCYVDSYSAGLGLSDGRFRIDYALLSKGELGFNNQISFTVGF